jgi:hypothetical protein
MFSLSIELSINFSLLCFKQVIRVIRNCRKWSGTTVIVAVDYSTSTLIKAPVTLGLRSHGDLDRHQITVQNASIAVGPPRHRHETPWNRLERLGTAFVFCCKLQKQKDRHHLKNTVGTPCNRRDNAVQSPWTSWQRSEVVVGTPRWPTAIARRLHSVYAAFMHGDYTAFTGRSWRFQSVCNTTDHSTAFSRSLHSVHSAFMAIPKRLHYDPTEFSRR